MLQFFFFFFLILSIDLENFTMFNPIKKYFSRPVNLNIFQLDYSISFVIDVPSPPIDEFFMITEEQVPVSRATPADLAHKAGQQRGRDRTAPAARFASEAATQTFLVGRQALRAAVNLEHRAT